MKIFLCGFTGSGKSTLLSKFTGNRLGYRTLDLDVETAQFLNLEPGKLGQFINQLGFSEFRKAESTVLINLLNSNDDCVIALGGGALTEDHYQLIRNQPENRIVFLNISLEVCQERIRGDVNRPLSLLSNEELQSLYETRLLQYKKADLSIGPDFINSIDGLETLVHNLR